MVNHDEHACVFNRRNALKGLGAAGTATAVAAGGLLTASQADASSRALTALPIPKPIGSAVPSNLPPPLPPEIHFALPGPLGATTPVIGLQAMGLDIDPSTIGDFDGFTAFAVLAGEARASDGELYPCEFDVRVMKGAYIAEDGSRQRAEFAFM